MRHIHVRLDNRQATLLGKYPLAKLLPYWSFSHPQYFHMRDKYAYYDWKTKTTKYFWDGKVKFIKRDRLGVGLFLATYKEIEKKEHVKFRLHVRLKAPKLSKDKYWIRSEGKYNFQNKCADIIEQTIDNGHGGLILNCTGSGKTRIAAMTASRFDCDFLFIVDQLDLLEQAREDVNKHLGEKIGKVGESKFKLRRFTVATRQTLAAHKHDEKFMKWFKRVDVVFIDEIHEQMNKSNFDVLSLAKPLSVIGLTATLGMRKKATRLKAWSIAGPVLFEYSVTQGMKDNVLSNGIVIQYMYNNKVPEIKIYDPNEAYDKYIVRNSERNSLIANLIDEAERNGKYIIVLVERIKHLEKLSRRLDSLKINHKVVSGSFKGEKIKVATRIKSRDKFEKGNVRVILANKVFKKGIDMKRVDFIINATGRGNQNDVIQIFGRGVRLHKDKVGLINIDISDYDSLDQDRKKKNWFGKNTKLRMRAFRLKGISIKKVIHDEDLDLIPIADRYLKKLIKSSNEG